MPFEIARKEDESLVIVETETSGDNAYETKELAEEALSELMENDDKASNIGLTSFDELEEAREAQMRSRAVFNLTMDYENLIHNIVFSDESNKGAEISRLSDEFANRVDAIVSGAELKAATLNELIENASDTSTKFREVMSKFSGAFGRIRRKSKKEVPTEEVTDTNEGGSFQVWKDKAGTYRWIARYSNKFRDDDHPKEIISSRSHVKFAELVKSGVVSPPKLWLWHKSAWEFGAADWVSYDDSGFAIAGGHIYDNKDCIAIAKELSELDGVGMSHGMPKWSIKRDEKDKTVITEHITTEITVLPIEKAANPHTGFYVLDDDQSKETDMAFSNDEKTRLMSEFGVSEALLGRIETMNDSSAKQATSEERDSKAKAGDKPAKDSSVDAKDEVDDAKTSEEVDDEKKETEFTITEATVVNILKSVIAVSDQVKTLTETVEVMKASEETRVAEKARMTPTASLEALMMKSVIGDDGASVDKRTAFSKEAPEETSAVETRTGIPFVDQFLGGK